MESVPCEVLMNEEETKTNVMEEKNSSLQTQESVVPQDEI
jgi:hypothetical protein